LLTAYEKDGWAKKGEIFGQAKKRTLRSLNNEPTGTPAGKQGGEKKMLGKRKRICAEWCRKKRL